MDEPVFSIIHNYRKGTAVIRDNQPQPNQFDNDSQMLEIIADAISTDVTYISDNSAANQFNGP